VKNLDWASILRDPQYIGLRITMIGAAMGFIAFVIAVCGFIYLGVSVLAISVSTALTGIVVNFSHVNRR
jgi:hypothetical protein